MTNEPTHLLNQKIEEICSASKKASYNYQLTSTKEKNAILKALSIALINHKEDILSANQIDIDAAIASGTKASMVDRLKLTDARIEQMASDLLEIVHLDDPVGKIESMWLNDENLKIGKQIVPLGVIGIIYESRPNVTIDAASLCLKTGNTVILKGGSDAINSNRALINIIQNVLKSLSYDPNIVQLIDTTDRNATTSLIHQVDYVDVIIPRGGASLINFVKHHSKVPIIETGTGNCHIFIDETAHINESIQIIINAKTQKPGACNAVETVLIHESIVEKIAPMLLTEFLINDVKVACDEVLFNIGKKYINYSDFELYFSKATDEDFQTEYLDYKVAIKTVASLDEAIAHINQYSTHHSEAILTENYSHAETFINKIDSSCVYINASTRFTDGNAFGFGAEIGISTQKLHARGPMGLDVLTSHKYIIYGNGQTRP